MRINQEDETLAVPEDWSPLLDDDDSPQRNLLRGAKNLLLYFVAGAGAVVFWWVWVVGLIELTR